MSEFVQHVFDSIDHNAACCPLCHQPLGLEMEHLGSYVLRCGGCGYRAVQRLSLDMQSYTWEAPTSGPYHGAEGWLPPVRRA